MTRAKKKETFCAVGRGKNAFLESRDMREIDDVCWKQCSMVSVALNKNIHKMIKKRKKKEMLVKNENKSEKINFHE